MKHENGIMNTLSNHLMCGVVLAGLCMSNLAAQEAKAAAPKLQDSKPQPADPKALIERLGDAKYQTRKQAEEQLRALGKDALLALDEAAQNSQDEEVRWRAQRIARQIRGGDAASGLKRRSEAQREDITPALPGAPFGPVPDLGEFFNRTFERMEREFGLDVPRRHFFQDEFFRDLERQMAESGRRGGMAQGQSFSMQMGPDGVKVEVRQKDANGKEETKKFEAPDLESFRTKYPEIAQQYLDQGRGYRLFLGPQPFWGGQEPRALRRVAPDQAETREITPEAIDTEPIPAGERLGVLVEPVNPEIAQYLGLAEGVGLAVRSVQEQTLAAKLGLREGDLVLKVQGKEIRGPADVRAALRGVEAGKGVRVEVLRRGKELILEGEKTEAAAAEAGRKPGLETKPKKAEIR